MHTYSFIAGITFGMTIINITEIFISRARRQHAGPSGAVTLRENHTGDEYDENYVDIPQSPSPKLSYCASKQDGENVEEALPATFETAYQPHRNDVV